VQDDPARALRAGHFGLLRMHERATAVGGTLAVTSAALAGTQVRLRVPLSQEPTSGE
jgi:signal transduction histidine kinase